MKNYFSALAAVVMAFGCGGTYGGVGSRVISVNFGNQGSATDSSGLYMVSADAWNNVSDQNCTDKELAVIWNGDSAETLASAFHVTWSCANLYQYTSNVTDPILKGYLDDGGSGINVSFTGLPFEKYAVVVYQATDTGNVSFNPPSINGTYYAYDGSATSATRNDTSLRYGRSQTAVSKWAVNAVAPGQAFSGDLTISGAGNANSARGCIAAIQIIEISDSPVAVEPGGTVTLSAIPTEFKSYSCEGALTFRQQDGVDLTRGDIMPWIDVSMVAGPITWDVADDGPLTMTAEGKTYLYGAAKPTEPTTIAHTARGRVTLTGSRPYYLDESHSGDSSEVTMTDATVVYKTAMGIGAATYTVGGATTITTGEKSDNHQSFVLSQGAASRAATFILKDTATVTVGGSNDADSNQNSVMFGHWNGPSTFTISDEAQFTAPGQVLIGKTGNTHVININGGTFTAKGLKVSAGALNNGQTLNLNGGLLCLGSVGITSYSDAKKLAINVTADSTIEATADTLPISQNITIDAGKTLTIDGHGTATIELTGSVTKSEGAVLRFQNADEVRLGTLRPLDYEFGPGVASIVVDEMVADDGAITFGSAIPAGVTVKIVRLNGDTEELGVATEGQTTFDYALQVSGAYCSYDFEFNGTLDSTGSKGGNLSRDTDRIDGQDIYIFGADAALDFKGAETNEAGAVTKQGFALWTGTHPYMSVTYPVEFTAAIYGTVPDLEDGAYMCFGTKDGGLVGLIRGTTANEVKLVRTTGDSRYEELCVMNVAAATTVSHLYVFTKTARQIKVYLDGEILKTYNASADITLGGGFQIASVHGGVGNTGIRRFGMQTEGLTMDDMRMSYIDSLRLYNGALGENAIAKLAEEFPYVSPHGEATRTIESGTANWSEENAWALTKDGVSSTAAVPETDMSVTLEATADAMVSVNLDGEQANYEKLTVRGNGGVTFTGEGTFAPSRVTIGTPVTVVYGAADFSKAPLTIENGGTLTFDCSAMDVSKIYTTTKFYLTGETEELDEGVVSCILPDAPPRRAIALVYDEATLQYAMVVTPDHEAGSEVYYKEGYFGSSGDIFRVVLPDGVTETSVFPDDTVVIDGKSTQTPIYVAAELPENVSKIQIDRSVTVCPGEANAVLGGTTITVSEGQTLTLAKSPWNGDNKVLGAVTLNGSGDVNLGDGVVVSGAITGSARVTIETGSTVSVGANIAKLTGAGKISLSNVNAITESLTGWTGTVEFPDKTEVDVGDVGAKINVWGTVGSTVVLNNMGTSGSKGAGQGTYLNGNITVNPKVVLKGTLYLNNGNSETTGRFTELSGAGTLSYEWSGSHTPTITRLTDFTGSLEVSDSARSIVVDEYNIDELPAINSKLISSTTADRITVTTVKVGDAEAVTVPLQVRADGLYVTLAENDVKARIGDDVYSTVQAAVDVLASRDTGVYVLQAQVTEDGTLESLDVGVIKTPRLATTILAVPFKGIDGNPVTVATLVAKGLANGDVMHVYGVGANEYVSFAYDGSNWSSADGNAADPVTYTLTPGAAVRLSRHISGMATDGTSDEVPGEFVVVGTPVAEESSAIADGKVGIAVNMTTKSKKVSEIKVNDGIATAGVNVFAPSADGSALYALKEGKWYKPHETTMGGVPVIEDVEVSDDDVVPAGTGYWVVNQTGSGVTVK